MIRTISYPPSEGSQTPPPSYASFIFKRDEDHINRTQPLTYPNNYPGPPLTDGFTPYGPSIVTTNHETRLSKTIRRYLVFSGLITMVFAFVAVGIQMSFLISHLITYYYYGFWGGILLFLTGLNTITLDKRQRGVHCLKLAYTFIWQTIFIGATFAIGLAIVLTDKCDNNVGNSPMNNRACLRSFTVLNGILLAAFGVALLQAILNGLIFCILSRKYTQF